MSRPYCIGLTGGIGSGKTSVAEMFRGLGAAIIDTDEIAREMTGPGGKAIADIRSQFGDDFIAPDGSLDRARMRQLVFGTPEARRKLENILHPVIRAEVRARIAALTEAYALIVVPLLLETGAYADLVRRVLVVDCDEGLQVERTMRRSALTESEVRAIMAAQISRQERLSRADDVIRNDGDMLTLQEQVIKLHEDYLRLARAH